MQVFRINPWIYPGHHQQYIGGYLYTEFKKEISYIDIFIYELFYALVVLNEGNLCDKNATQYSLIIIHLIILLCY